jgi:GH24 family phage-related lysozyme (muramidase)
LIRIIYLFNNQPHLISYDTENGIVCYDQVASSGKSLNKRWCETWSLGFTSIKSFKLGASTIILSYKIRDGTFHMDKVLPTGRGISSFKRDHWSAGYTSIVPFILNNVPHLLSYKSEDGHMEIDSVSLNGDLFTKKETEWSAGWSIIVSYDKNNPSHILSYEAATGIVHFDEIDPTQERGVRFMKKFKWSPGWTSIAPFQLDNRPHIVSYETSSGIVHFDEIDLERERGVRFINKTKWSTDWIELLPFNLGNRPHILSYKFNGQVDIDEIVSEGGDTRNTFTRPPFNIPAAPCQPLPAGTSFPLMDISNEGLSLLERIEGKASLAPSSQRVTGDEFGLYNDSKNHCTKGIGHLEHEGPCTANDINNYNTRFPGGMSREQALDLLRLDLVRFVNVVNNNIRVQLTQEQFDALVVFAFNVGEGNPPPTTRPGFRGSNLLRLINQGSCDPATILKDGFLGFTSGGELTSRRCIEANLFNNGVYR